MKKNKILESMEYVDDEIIEEADGYASAKKKHGWLKYGVMAACFCLVLAGTFVVKKSLKPLPEENTPAQLVIPSVELPNSSMEDGVMADMIGLVVYNGGVYTQAEDYYGDDATAVDALIGDYLGYASGTIDEWSKKEEYDKNFASTVSGKVYTVKGYDTDFRICIRAEVEDENGNPTLWIQFLTRLNGITLDTGADLFENRLHMQGNVKSIQWQSHADWDLGGKNLRDLHLNSACWEDFLNQMNHGKFVYTWTDDMDQSIYDTSNQVHLILTMEDNTIVRLRLIEGGYVGYDALGWYFVQIPGETFDAVYAACGGTHS